MKKLESPIEFRVDFTLEGEQGNLCRYFQAFTTEDALDMFKRALVIDEIPEEIIESYSVLEYNRFTEEWTIQHSKDQS